MSSRKGRLSLSKDVHKEKDAKTPNSKRTSARTPVARKSNEPSKNDESCEVSPSQGGEYSPLVLTQDNSYLAINGVSWEWNSPQRIRDQQRVNVVVSKNYHRKPPMRPTYSHSPVAIPRKPTGFNKFISKLNLLMEKENMGEDLKPPQPGPDDTDFPEESCLMGEYVIGSDKTNQNAAEATPKTQDSDDDLFQEHVIDTPNEQQNVAAVVGTELDDSKLDNLLIEASQTVEQNFNKPVDTSPPQQQSKPTSIVKRSSPPAPHNIPIEMNDSDMDGFLVQASLMVEEKLSDSSQESTSNNNAKHKMKEQSNSNAPAKTAAQTDYCKRITTNASAPAASEGTSEISMSQEDLKALIEKKRQEALRRLQNNRLKRGIKVPISHG
uniref:Uncharacterized protein n=1 Tax=Anopheles farauti TaxID=69004 RepID=A0A182PZG3_9DIPT